MLPREPGRNSTRRVAPDLERRTLGTAPLESNERHLAIARGAENAAGLVGACQNPGLSFDAGTTPGRAASSTSTILQLLDYFLTARVPKRESEHVNLEPYTLSALFNVYNVSGNSMLNTSDL